jgi:hypothetical protein
MQPAYRSPVQRFHRSDAQPELRADSLANPAQRASVIQMIQRQASGPLPPPVLVAKLQMLTGQRATAGNLAFGPLQRSADEDAQYVHEAAARGISGNASALPFMQQIQRSFGRYDVSGVRSFVGGEAATASEAMGAEAYATGDSVAFKDSPDLHTAAHEAAHIVQQRGGVQLKDGVGRKGDDYEQHADAVADLVVQGLSAEALLDQKSGQQGEQREGGAGLQRKSAVQRDTGDDGDGISGAPEPNDPPLDPADGGAPNVSGGSPRPVEAKNIVMKRKDIDFGGDDKYGHWWTELNGNESYGWWPKYPLGPLPGSAWKTLTGVEGELNGQTTHGGTPTLDPHHGDPADEVFHPTIIDPSKPETTAIDECRSFATSYSGEWRWTLGWGQNCHTFQEQMMEKVGLRR